MNFERYIEIFKELKNQGVEKQDAEDCLEFDSDQYPDPKEIKAALNKVYGD